MADNTLKRAEERTNSLLVDDTKLSKIMELLEGEFLKGLKDEDSAVIKMLITYVRNLPKGDEIGKYLALDLGGTNFRVLMIDLKGREKPDTKSKTYEIPKELMVGAGEVLFDHIAKCLIDFVIEQQLQNIRIALGFTFSFPCRQLGLSQAKLVTWTKGFKCSRVVNRDIVKLLKDALKRNSHNANAFVDIVAVINDTTGTLMSCAHEEQDCRIGLIAGTGCNACYIEELLNIEKWPSNYSEPKQVIINTEWGAFGDNSELNFIKTEWDCKLDTQSINRGKQTFEKMISGMYLGELVRLVLLTLIEENLLFGGIIPNELNNRNSFLAKYVSKIDSDSSKSGFPLVKDVMKKHFNLTNCSDTDCKIIYVVNNRVSKRAAHLVSAGCATLLNRIGKSYTIIGYDGSLLRFHPFFTNWMQRKITQLVKSQYKFKLMLSKDGSGRGAAIVAAVSYKEKRPKIIKRNGKLYEIMTYLH